MKRLVYAFDAVAPAREAVTMLRQRGIAEPRISIVARSDIELGSVPDDLLDVNTDFVPAIGRGVAVGGVTGVIAGLIAMAIPPLGLAVAGSTLLACFAGGALVGAWSSALIGASVPDEISRRFDDEIQAGHVLLVVDSDSEDDAKIIAALNSGTDRHLLWETEVDGPAAL